MKNFIFTSLVCLISIAVFSQEKTRTTSSQDTLQGHSNGKPVFIDTGNPIADQERYDNAKTKYIKENPSSVQGNAVPKSLVSPESKEDIAKKIQQIDSHINSINIKTNDILNNPEQKIIAETEGWFEDMKATKERLESKKQALLKLLEN